MRRIADPSPPRADRTYKATVAASARRRAAVTGYTFGGQPLVEVRLIRAERGEGESCDFSLNQARQLVRILSEAIERAEEITRHDGSPSAATGRGPAGRNHADVERQARTRA